jgi:DNA-binding MarR family transcriptional regulator
LIHDAGFICAVTSAKTIASSRFLQYIVAEHIVDLDNNLSSLPNCSEVLNRVELVRREDRLVTRARKPTASALVFRNQASRRRSSQPTIALGALNSHLGYFVRRLQVWIFQDFISALKRIDISPAQFSVLVVVGANRGLSQAELATTLGIERARLARLLHRLEERGAIRRLQSSTDGRRHALQLTPHGRTTLARAKTLAARHQKRLTERLGAEKHQVILEALRNF